MNLKSSVNAVCIFDNIIEKYLVKKYPNIEKMYDKVNSLTNDISLKEQQFMEMRRKKEKDKAITSLSLFLLISFPVLLLLLGSFLLLRA